MVRVLRIAAIVLAALISNSPAGAAEDGAASSLARYKAYMGWTLADHTVSSLRITGEFGKQAWRRTSRGAVYRETLVNASAQSSDDEGFSGKQFWHANINHQLVPMAGRARLLTLSEAYVFANAVSELNGTLRENSTPGIDVVRVTPPNGAPIDLSIKHDTGELTRFVLDPDRAGSVYVIRRFAEIASGKRTIADYDVDKTPVVAKTIVANTPVVDSELAPPEPRSSWTFAEPRMVHIERQPAGVIFDASVNGVRGRFLLDTGASHIALTDSYARKAGVKKLGDLRIATATGGANAKYGSVDTITIGGNVLRDAIVTTGVALDGLDGLLGFDVAAAAIVSVDFKAGSLTVEDPDNFTRKNETYFEMPADLSRGVPLVTVKFDDKREGYLIVDSGNTADTLVGFGLHDVLGVQRTFMRGYVGAGSILGSEAQCGYVDTVAVEKMRLHNSVVCFQEQGGDNGLLGFAFLERFNWVLDYPEARIFLSKR